MTQPSTASLARRALPLAAALACALALGGCGRRGALQPAGTEQAKPAAAEPGVASPAPQAKRSQKRAPIVPPRRDTPFDVLL